ncbi:MAG: DoxX family protein [Opitutales bacterium]
MTLKILSWVAQVALAIILGQTLFFKFTDAPETVELFGQLGMGAFGYKLIGALELIACVLLLIPSSIAWGALLAWGLMSGAILAHVTRLGFEGEAGVLGSLAIAAWALSIFIMWVHRKSVPFFCVVFKRERQEMRS